MFASAGKNSKWKSYNMSDFSFQLLNASSNWETLKFKAVFLHVYGFKLVPSYDIIYVKSLCLADRFFFKAAFSSFSDHFGLFFSHFISLWGFLLQTFKLKKRPLSNIHFSVGSFRPPTLRWDLG